MEKTRKIRCFTTFIILIILIIILLIMNVCIGTVHISFKAAFATLYDHSDRVGRIVWDIRMPRAIAAMILGGALALAGYLLQTFFHNIKVPKHPTKHTTWHNYQNIYYAR